MHASTTARSSAAAGLVLVACVASASAEVVDGSRATTPALEIAADGRILVLHGWPDLQLTSGSGAPWTVEPAHDDCADAQALAQSPSGALVGCAVSRYGEILAGLDDGSGWSFETLDAGYPYGASCVAGWPGDGRPLVAWSLDGEMHAARLDGTAWSIEPMLDTDGAPLGGAFLSLAVAPDGRPAVSFSDRALGTVSFAVEGVDGWEVESVAIGVDSRCTALDFAPDGRAAVAYRNQDTEEDLFALRDASGWTQELVRSRFDGQCGRTLRHLPDGRAVLGAYDAILTREATGWTVEPLPPEAGAGPPDRMEIDAAGRIVVASNETVAIREAAGDWRVDPIAENRQHTNQPTLALAPDDTTWLAYGLLDIDGDSIVAARPPGDAWTVQAVPFDDVVVQSSDRHSLAFDDAGRPAYAVAAWDQSLHFVSFDGSDWIGERLPFSPTWFPSLVFGPTDEPVIAFIESGNVLRLATREAGSWSAETIAPVTDSSIPHLGVDRLGSLFVVHVSENELRVARRAGENDWTIETIAQVGPRGGGAWLGETQRRQPAVSYEVDGSAELRLAIEEPDGWRIESLPLRGSFAAREHSFAFDPDGRLFFALKDRDSDLPLVAWREWGEWVTAPVETDARTSWPPRLALSASGDLVVAYGDACAADVRVTNVAPPEREFLLVRKSIDSLSRGWRTAAFPLTRDNDDEAGDFPLTRRPVQALDELDSGPLVLYKGLVSDGTLPPTLRVEKRVGITVVSFR